MPGQHWDVVTQRRMGDVLLPGFIPLPPGQRHSLTSHSGLCMSPHPPAVRGFSLRARNQSEEQEGPETADKQLLIKSLFWLVQKRTWDLLLCASPLSPKAPPKWSPGHPAPRSLSDIQHVSLNLCHISTSGAGDIQFKRAVT